MPGAVLRVLHVLLVILTTILWGRFCHYSHFTDHKTEAQGG